MLRDERGLTTLEKIGVAAIVVAVLSFFPIFRSLLADFYDAIFRQTDPDTGQISQFSIAARGILITIVSVAAFIGSGAFLLATNLGKRLAFLVAGAATSGWLVVNGVLFVVYAPRGLRPDNLEGLNAFQFRIPAIGMTIGSFVVFLMFVAALDRYEKQRAEAQA